MQSTIREFQGFLANSLGHPRFWTLFAAIIALFTLVGPFGTFDRLGFLMRLAYWTVTMTGTWLIAITTISLMLAVAPRTISPVFAVLAGTFLSSFFNAAYLNLIIHWFLDIPPELGFWYQFAYALPMSVIFGLIIYFAMGNQFDRTGEPLGAEPENPLINRLPHAKRGSVMHLSMQDHYVKVATTKGTELVLMRMADAVHALSKQDGLQIHRSHWIARDHVADSRRENGQPIVIMKDGAEIPVSRSYTKAAREAGVI